jgi:hypothetical protein
LKEGLEGGVGKVGVAFHVESVAVDGVIFRRMVVENIGEGDLMFFGNFSQSMGVDDEVGGVHEPGFDLIGVFAGHRRKEDDAGGIFAVVGLGLQVGEEFVEALLEGGEAFGAGEGFVVAVGGDDEIGFDEGEVLVEVGEVVGPGHEVHFVGGPGEVADDEFVVRVVLVEEGLEMTVAALGIEEEVADEGNAGPFFKGERQGGGDRLGGFGPWRGLEVEVVLGELRVLIRSCLGALSGLY